MPKIQKICIYCGQVFNVYPSNASAKLCSIPCRSVYLSGCNHHNWGRKTALTCQWCGCNYEVKISVANRKGALQTRFCSKKCTDLHRGATRKGENNPKWAEKIIKECAWCNTGYEVRIKKEHCSRYCSHNCMFAANASRWAGKPSFNHKPKTVVQCKRCAKSFEVKPSKASVTRFCSIGCKNAGFSEQMASNLEDSFAEHLRDSGIDFERHKPVDRCVPDFWIKGTQFLVEVDGDYWHGRPESQIRDKRRDAFLRSRGFTVIRFPEHRIKNDVRECMQELLTLLKEVKIRARQKEDHTT